jgi:hypothetical protein
VSSTDEAPAGADRLADVPTGPTDPGARPAADDATVTTRRRRSWPWAVTRAAVVMAVSVVAYSFVVPQHTAIPARVDSLLPARNGTSDFPGPAKEVAPHPASSAGLKSLSAAAKSHPHQTGVAVAQWAAPGSPRSGGNLLIDVAFLTPSPATVGKVVAELKSQALGPNTYDASGLVRANQFSVKGVTDSAGAVFSGRSSGRSPGSVAAVVFSVGRVAGYVEVARTTGSPQADAQAAVATEAARLAKVEPGFTLTPTRYPTVATAGWAAATVVLAALVGFGPMWRRRRIERREAARRAEAERLIRVGGSTIVRTRRGS